MASRPSVSASGKDWQSLVAEKRASSQKAMPEAWILQPSFLKTLPSRSEFSKTKIDLISQDVPRRSGIMTERELQITESYNVSELLDNLASGKLTSFETTVAFSKRAAIAQQLTDCLTETFFERAQERARELDDLRAKGKLVGPLHGLPVSIKDTNQVEGTHATIGAVAYLDQTSKENSPLVDILLELGAVLYVKTNVSQMLMSVDSHNNIFDRVLNPWNTTLTAGGSSGGEGALLAFRGSPLGIGTDLAGSIRIPSLCCGTYGFKPSSGRIPFGGQRMPDDKSMGFGILSASSGPLANDIEALGIFMKSVIDTKPLRHDATVIDQPWRAVNETLKPRLRLGLLPEDPIFPLHPPVKETISKALEVLRSQGHEVVMLNAAECHVAAATEVAKEAFSLENSVAEFITSSGEPIVPSVQRFGKELGSVEWSLSSHLASLDRPQKLAVLRAKKAEIAEAWSQLWLKYELDGVISPSAQNTAVEHDKFGWPPYSVFLNILDYPACIIPFGKAGKSGQGFTKRPGQVATAYNPEAVGGSPCSVQVFTGPALDEKCLAVAGVIDKCLKMASH